MSYRLILGIDPGQTGAIALLADGVPAGFIDIPTRERVKGGGRMVDALRLASELRGTLLGHRGAHLVAVIERVQSMPGNGNTADFRFGQADGIVRAVVQVVIGAELLEVEPQTWKRHFGLLKTEKDAARVYAMAKFPRAALQMLQKKHGGRADALLVAAWCEETEAYQRTDAPADAALA